jgi:hypothetical protein
MEDGRWKFLLEFRLQPALCDELERFNYFCNRKRLKSHKKKLYVDHNMPFRGYGLI